MSALRNWSLYSVDKQTNGFQINLLSFFLIIDKLRGTLLLSLLPNKQHA